MLSKNLSIIRAFNSLKRIKPNIILSVALAIVFLALVLIISARDRAVSLVLASLTPESLQLLALSVDFRLITADLVVLLGVPVILALQLIAHQGTSTQAETAADRRADARMADSAADYTADRRATERPDSCALLTRGQRTTGTAADKNRPYQDYYTQFVLNPFHLSTPFCSLALQKTSLRSPALSPVGPGS
jgi:hypothetical protein